MDTPIRKAHEKMMSVAQDPEMMRLYEMREKALREYNRDMDASRRKGLAAGEQRGLRQAQADFVRRLSLKNRPVEEIAELTGLPVEEVNHIMTVINTGADIRDEIAEDRPTLQQLIETDPSIRNTYEEMMSIAQDPDPEMMRLHDRLEMGLCDYVSGMNASRRKGMAAGEQRGLQQAQADFALRLFRKNRPVEEIAELTGLPAEEVSRMPGAGK
jgi:DNA-directed RNA polymerase specialized sigma subunit